ncbi:hypothetical protein JAAARDRAFT_119045 [Jaapia argillacea MUCL 33604]|uniref:Dilute domain-containing protein n=1 Tax=Jaapia argillacea MUCL 33604 TaxID=933084 RepID=A0A067Q965_9AGAM|nr:hypothetical protein JAAARDRAFT_119045 [Jaapia argillacea MUCL 33604]
MASSSFQRLDLSPEPDLHPLYPLPSQIAPLLSRHSGLSPAQKSELVSHCMSRACVFGDLSLLSYLFTDSQAQAYVDLGVQDEDGLSLISVTILGFGSESERDVEREECVRLLASQGADIHVADNSGWTPLHHAALFAPPTLVSYLLTRGASLFVKTRRKLTALDIVTAHSTVPGREDVALLLEEAMRSEGWSGGKLEEARRLLESRRKRKGKEKSIRNEIGSTLGIAPKWWGADDSDTESSEDEEEEEVSEELYTPPLDYTSMLVYSPESLPYIFQSLILNFPISLGNSHPAKLLYRLARFACLTCDHTWLEEFILGATDSIEATMLSQTEDITCLVFWLYNATVWLHLMRCDESINEACLLLGSFDIIEELINSIFVFIIRFAEQRIDQLLDSALLDYSPLSSEFESIQFESEWSFLRSFGTKKKNTTATVTPSTSGTPLRNGVAPPSTTPSRPPSPPPQTHSRSFSSFAQSLSRARGPPTPLQALFQDISTSPTMADVTGFLSALHTLLTLAGVNPALITQLWSQIMYWTACETFNRILTRKKYLCRSKAIQISVNVSTLEEWVGKMALPRGVESHFAPVRELLNWLQCLSSITEFANLIATIQTMKHLNPLQMRRAVRDYKYEVNEGRMTEECTQYLAQLQKDWERHRVKLGVEALRKEVCIDRDYEDNESFNDNLRATSISTTSSELGTAQRNIDMLFDRAQEKSAWEPAKPPQALGELLDSRFMLPLLFPSDPRMLGAAPVLPPNEKRRSDQLEALDVTRSASRASMNRRGAVSYQLKSKQLRDVSVDTLRWVDGVRSAARWVQLSEPEEEDREPSPDIDPMDTYENEDDTTPHITPFTRKPSARSRGSIRASWGGETTPIE